MSVPPMGRAATSRLQAQIRSQKLNILQDANIQTFRDQAFIPQIPVQIPRQLLPVFPATSKWFTRAGTAQQKLNTSYLQRYGSAVVPLEITSSTLHAADFAKVERPLSDFLSFLDAQDALPATTPDPSAPVPQIYLAQCPLSSLPLELSEDVPTPAIVTHAGRGDVYGSSIWVGRAPTYTPLHKDPNPNVFVQLAGRKVVRAFEPRVGAEIYAQAMRELGRMGSASFRGEEMMAGEEKRVLDEMVWGDGAPGDEDEQAAEMPSVAAYEAVLDAGEGIFIPKGWWHSIKGIGSGIVGSVRSSFDLKLKVFGDDFSLLTVSDRSIGGFADRDSHSVVH